MTSTYFARAGTYGWPAYSTVQDKKLINLPGGTILPRVLFQKRYVNGSLAICYCLWLSSITTSPWPSVSESIFWVRLRVTVFCILPLPRVTLGITAKEVKLWTRTARNLHASNNFSLQGQRSRATMHTSIRLIELRHNRITSQCDHLVFKFRAQSSRSNAIKI